MGSLYFPTQNVLVDIKLYTTPAFISILAKNPVNRNFELSFWETSIEFALTYEKDVKFQKFSPNEKILSFKFIPHIGYI